MQAQSYQTAQPPAAPRSHCPFCGTSLASWQDECPTCHTKRDAIEPPPPTKRWLTWRRTFFASLILGFGISGVWAAFEPLIVAPGYFLAGGAFIAVVLLPLFVVLALAERLVRKVF